MKINSGKQFSTFVITPQIKNTDIYIYTIHKQLYTVVKAQTKKTVYFRLFLYEYINEVVFVYSVTFHDRLIGTIFCEISSIYFSSGKTTLH